LHPGAKEEFFGYGGKEKYCHPAQEGAADSRQVAMGMDEAERQSERDDDGGEISQLAQASFPVAPLQMKIESGSAQLADRQKPVQARIHQKQFVQGAQAAWP